MKIITDFKKSFLIGILETKTILFSIKFVLLLLLSWVIMDFFIRNIRTFAIDFNETIVPAEIPFYFSNVTYGNIALLFLIYLFSDMPLKNGLQMQLLQRAGIRCFGIGQIFAIIKTTLIFVASQLCISVIVCFPCLALNDWGKIWQSAANNQMLELGYNSPPLISQDVISNYSAWEAIGISAALFSLTGICYGVVIYLLNGLSHSNLGTILLTIWSIGWILLNTFSSHQKWVRFLFYFSPSSWNNLSHKNIYDILNTGLRIALCIILLSIIIQFFIKIRKIEII